MRLSGKDIAATFLTALMVLVLGATAEGWPVPLVGDSHRWAAGVILAIGMVTCGLGSPGRDAATWILGALGVLALGLAIAALVTGSLTLVWLLVADNVVLWAAATMRHVGTDLRGAHTT
jgi:hypothetical protein